MILINSTGFRGRSLTKEVRYFFLEDDMQFKTFLTVLTVSGSLAAGAASAQNVDYGHSLFMDYCAACHGESGKGDGDVANVMTIPAPNLTLLASQNDGEFPMLKVIHVIDGRTGVRSHGGPMPFFGRVFSSDDPREENPYGSVLETRGRVLSLALYLESIQQ